MPEQTRKNATSEAFEQAELNLNESKKRYGMLIDTAVFITLLTASLFVVQYVYYKNYFKVYNISEKAIRLNLKYYAPFAAHVFMMGIFVLMFIALIKADSAVGNYRVSISRILIASLVFNYFFIIYHFLDYIQPLIVLAISFGIPTMFEIIRYLSNKSKKNYQENRKNDNKTIDKETYKTVLKNTIYNILYYKYYYKTGIFILTLAVCLVAQLSPLIAKSNNEYQIVSYDNKAYAVIMDYEEDVIVEPITEKNNKLTIHTDYYKYLSKENLEITNKKFDKVIIK